MRCCWIGWLYIGLGMIGHRGAAQSLYTQTGTDPTWDTIIANDLIPVGESSSAGILGSDIDVNNALVEQGPYAGNPIVSGISIHTLGNSNVPRSSFPKWTRWYQEDGNTQVFRLFTGEYNVRNDRPQAARIEAFSDVGWSTGAWHEWVGTYTIVKPGDGPALFQAKNNINDWSVALNMNENGDIKLNRRRGDDVTIATDMTGKSFDLRVRDNGHDYEVYLNGDFKGGGSFSRPEGLSRFRWGMYVGTADVTRDMMVFVTGATVDPAVQEPVVAADTIRVEAWADGSAGSALPAQSLEAGESITCYAVASSAGGVLMRTVPADWQLIDRTGTVTAGDLVPSADGKSAVFTARGPGSARILAEGEAPNLAVSGVITVEVPTGVIGDTLLADTGDAEVQVTLGTPPYAIKDADTTGLIAGTAGSVNKERCPVLPFRLPDRGAATNPFLSAYLSLHYRGKNSTVRGNVDVYGLGRRSGPAVLTSDYWSATGDPDPTDAAFLADNIVTADSTEYGLKIISNGALLNYLNAQYDGGAGAGDYVFIRLSTDAPQTGGANRYNFTSADGGMSDPDLWPKIIFTAVAPNTPPTLEVVNDQTLIAGQTLTVTNLATDGDVPAQALSFGLQEPPAGASIHPGSGVLTWRPGMAQAPSTHTIAVKVSDSGTPTLSATNQFLVTVMSPAAVTLSPAGWNGSEVVFTVSGDRGPDYHVQASTNLTSWVPVQTVPSADPPFPVTDPDAANFNWRFYRVLLGP